MALDTMQKRMSAMNHGSPWRGPLVDATEGGTTQGNRQAAAFMASSILAGAASGSITWLYSFPWPFWDETEASGEDADGEAGDDGSGGGDDVDGAPFVAFPLRAIFPPLIPPNPFAGPLKGIVPRDPEAEKRSRGNTQINAEVLNSLMRRGEIVMYGPKQWRLNASPAVTANRAPTATDDFDAGFMVGQIWVNETTGDVYILAFATPGAAVWRGPLV